MTKQIIDRGTADDDGTGDPLSTWANKTNANADQLFAGAGWFRFVSRTTSAEPGGPTDGDTYLLPSSGCTGTNWSGNDGKIATWSGTYDRSTGSWFFLTVEEGHAGWIQDEDIAIVYNSTWERIYTNGVPKVRAATTAAITLATDLENADTIDGVTLATGDRVLVKDQASGAENGVYVVAATGAPTRATDADSSAELVNYACFVAEGTTNADKFFQCTTNATITVDTTALTFTEFTSGGTPGGTQEIWIPATAMTSRTTSGAAAGSSETSTNKIMVETLDFDDTTDEFAQIRWRMPKRWDEGTVTVGFVWTAAATGNVVWGAQGVAISNDDPVDSAFGTAQTVTDAVTAANDVMESAATGAITIGGTPAENDFVVFQFYRDADNGSDTLTGDALLLGVVLTITTDANDDS